VEHALVQLYRGQRLIETRPPSVPWLQLGARQLRFDFQHMGAEEVQSLLVLFARALEVQSDLEAAVAAVVPGLVVKLGMAEMHLHEPAPTSGAAELPQRSRQFGFAPLTQPAEEVRRRQHGPTSQRA